MKVKQVTRFSISDDFKFILLTKLLIMNKLFLSFIFASFTVISFAGDILTLNNQMVYEGEVIKIKNCEVYFKADGQKYIIPSSDIFSVQFENTTDKVFTDYLKLADSDPNKCLNGRLDAEAYHGKQGLHFALGVLFGPFAMIGTALSNPTPERGKQTISMSKNKDQFNDPEYLKCYKKEAKGNLVLMESLGWLSWVLFGILISN